jgi:hypothetical protein
LSIPGFGRQVATFFCREIETVARDRVGLRMGMLLPLALAAVVLAGFSATKFRNPLMLTRLLDPGEKKVLADVWGEVAEAIATETVAEQDASIPGQIRVFLDSQPKLLAHLREPSTARIVRDSLTDTNANRRQNVSTETHEVVSETRQHAVVHRGGNDCAAGGGCNPGAHGKGQGGNGGFHYGRPEGFGSRR